MDGELYENIKVLDKKSTQAGLVSELSHVLFKYSRYRKVYDNGVNVRIDVGRS